MRRLYAIAASVGLGLALVALYLLAWPVPIQPEAWVLPEYDPAAWVPTGGLQGAEQFDVPDGLGAEDLAIDARGRVYSGDSGGRILRWDAPGATPTVVAETGGHPLGLDWAASGDLI